MIIIAIASFLDEERYLPTFLDSMSTQSRRPDRLVLVDDGSSDASPEIAERFVAKHPYATLLRRPRRPPEQDRLAAAAELRSFQWALEQIDEPWDVVAKLDADLRLSPDLFERLEHEFDSDPKLGIAGPFLSVVERTVPVRQRCPPEHVEGAARFYRRECYAEISPLPVFLGWDTIDEARARLRGWRTASFAMASGDPLHLRRMGAYDGILRGARRRGVAAYAFGAHPLHVALGAAARVRNRPAVLGSLSYVLGWALAAVHRLPRAEPEVREFVRREELRRITQRLSGGPRP